MMDEVDRGMIEEVFDTEDLLNLGDTVFSCQYLTLALVHLIVPVLLESVDDLGEIAIPPCAVRDAPRDDERGPGFVDQDRVDLVDDGVGVTPLYAVDSPHRHVVSQIVEAE